MSATLTQPMDRLRIGQGDRLRLLALTTGEAQVLGAIRLHIHLFEGGPNFAMIGEALGVTRARVRQVAKCLEQKKVLRFGKRNSVELLSRRAA